MRSSRQLKRTAVRNADVAALGQQRACAKSCAAAPFPTHTHGMASCRRRPRTLSRAPAYWRIQRESDQQRQGLEDAHSREIHVIVLEL